MVGKPQVDDCQIGTELLDPKEAILGIVARTNNLKVVARFEYSFETLLNQSMIVNQDYRFQPFTFPGKRNKPSIMPGSLPRGVL